MRIDEIDFGKRVTDSKAKVQELQELGKKVKGMYEKAQQNFADVEIENAEQFDAEPMQAFANWFKHMFKNDVEKVLNIPALKLSDANIKKVGKLVVAYASQNYYLKPKTPFQGANTFMKIVKIVDPQLVNIADQVFGRFVRGEEQKNPEKLPDDIAQTLQNLTDEQKAQLDALLNKAGSKA